MGYIDSNLLPGETIVQRSRLHWVIFMKAAVVVAVGFALLLIEPRTIGLIVIAIGAAMAVPPWIARISSEFGVTSRRVIVKIGVVQRRTVELLIRQVEAISVDQSIAGRLLNFGTVTLTGTGGVRETFRNISNPLEFRRSIQSLSAS
jgi:hypothetical protein